MNDESASADKINTLTLLTNIATKVTLLLVLAACTRQSAGSEPTPFPKPTIPCDRDASVLTQAQPEFPDEAREKRIHEAQVAVQVDITASGRLERTRVVQSSGIPALDASALLAADGSTYEPPRKHCKPVSGSYIFRVTFSGND